MTQRSTLRAGAAFVLLVCFGTAAVAQDPKQRIKEAYDQVQRGKNDEALKILNDILATDPSSEQALDLRNALEARQWIDVSVADGRLGEVVVQLFARAMPAAAGKTGDVAEIDKLLAEARGTTDWAARRKALTALMHNHGEYAVIRLWNDLGHSEAERRAQAIDWLRGLGADVALPLVQTLRSDNAMIRANAAIVLGMIEDRRSVPYLMMVAERDADESVKSAAAASLRRHGASGGSAVDAGVALAEQYYRRDPRAVNQYRTVYPVWTLVKGEEGAESLVAHEVPRDLYHLKLAEAVLFDVLPMQPDHEAGRTLLASTLLAQSRFGAGVAGEGEEAAAMKTAAMQSRILAAAQGPAILSRAVTTAIEQGRQDVAVAAIELLAEMVDAESFGDAPGLVAALSAPTKATRYAAALAVARIRPRNHAVGDQVVAALAQALGEDAFRTAVVVDDVGETSRRICADLEARQWFCVAAASGPVGVARLRDYPIEDVVIVRYDLAHGHVSDVIRAVRADERTKETPVFLLVEARDMEAAKANWDGKVQGFIEAPPVGEAFEPALRAATKSLDVGREAAIVTAAAAAEALAMMDPRGTGMSSAAAKDALAASLKGDDRVRMPAVRALGAIADPSTEPALIALLTDANAPENVRGEAAKALARISRAAGRTSPEFGAALREVAFKGGSQAFLMALSEATGLLPVAPQTRLGVMRFARPASVVDLVK
ncbi:MAG TPA: HEAT repeat domain-containing protein [Planctomycetota bacterium]|nr:HEAT repeat domain-containing protein [Planctomycetota bacterium]